MQRFAENVAIFMNEEGLERILNCIVKLLQKIVTTRNQI